MCTSYGIFYFSRHSFKARQTGSSLIEVLIALLLFCFCSISLLDFHSVSISRHQKSIQRLYLTILKKNIDEYAFNDVDKLNAYIDNFSERYLPEIKNQSLGDRARFINEELSVLDEKK